VTVAEWRSSDDPEPMVRSLPAGRYHRELRLFALACCRRIWPLLTDPRSRQAVEISERYDRGLADTEELSRAVDEAIKVYEAVFPGHSAPDASAFASSAAVDAASTWLWATGNILPATSCAASGAACAAAEAVEDERYDDVYEMTLRAELAAQADLLRSLVRYPPGAGPDT